MKPFAAFTLLTVLSLVGSQLACRNERFQAPIVEVVAVAEDATALEKAQQSVFLVRLPKHFTAGSAILTGRTKVEGGYRYRALSAYHVLDELASQLGKEGVVITDDDMTLDAMFQPEFHGEPVRLSIVIDIDWAVPASDWVGFTFVMDMKLECTQLASEEEFKAIRPFETIYGIGCDGARGQLLRQGTLGATHNVEFDLQKQWSSPYPWDQHADLFFRAHMNIWFGASGGAIFNKDGKLIGIFNGINIGGGFSGPVAHGAVCLKAHYIKHLVSNVDDFFKVED